MVDIKLGNKWDYIIVNNIEIYLFGYLYFRGQLISNSLELYNLICNNCDLDLHDYAWIGEEFLGDTSGNFSFVFKNNNVVIVSVDIIRSKPVYIIQENGMIKIRENISVTGYGGFDLYRLQQFLSSMFVFEENSIYQNVKSLRPGECVQIYDGKIKSQRYFYFDIDKYEKLTGKEDELCKELDEKLLNIFKKTVDSAESVNNWIVPLSGGHDSRLIVNYLHKLGLKNVLCFSYGIENNEQSNISKKVAEKLGYRWEFVRYSEKKWFKLHQKGIFDDFLEIAFNGESTPHYQDFLAICELREKGIIGDKDVIVPGHAFDFLAGSHLTEKVLNLKKGKDVINLVKSKFANVWPNNNNKFPQELHHEINKVFNEKKLSPQAFVEYFNWSNRQTKFIANSVRVYEYFDLKWRMPFWDAEIVNFWLSVDSSKRKGRNFFLRAEKSLLLDEIKDIPFAKDKAKMDTLKKRLRKLLKDIIPSELIVSVNRLLKRKVKISEGLNQIYCLRANTVKDLIGPIELWPQTAVKSFEKALERYCYQVNPHALSTLYTIRRVIINNAEHKHHFGLKRGIDLL